MQSKRKRTEVKILDEEALKKKHEEAKNAKVMKKSSRLAYLDDMITAHEKAENALKDAAEWLELLNKEETYLNMEFYELVSPLDKHEFDAMFQRLNAVQLAAEANKLLTKVHKQRRIIDVLREHFDYDSSEDEDYNSDVSSTVAYVDEDDRDDDFSSSEDSISENVKEWIMDRKSHKVIKNPESQTCLFGFSKK